MTTKRIVVAAQDDHGLAGEVSQHFGRCPYYVLADTEEGDLRGYEIQANPLFGNHQPGSAPNYIAQLGADVILAGGMGPRAVEMFNRFGIDVATGVAGRVVDVINSYLSGELRGTVPCAHDHPESCGKH